MLSYKELLKLIELRNRYQPQRENTFNCQSLSCFSWHLYLEVSASSHSYMTVLNDLFVDSVSVKVQAQYKNWYM